MNRQIRRLGVALLVLYAALFVQLNVVQVLRADEYSQNPHNRREVLRDFGKPRGIIQTADGELLARSVELGGDFKYGREYPQGPLYGHITGYYSFAFGADGVEKTYTDHLSGRTAPDTVEGFTDLLLEDDRTGDVTLTIDHRVQQAAAQALGDRPGSVVALDPRTGAVLAMYSNPTYDPNGLVNPDGDAAAAYRAGLEPDSPSSALIGRTFRTRFFPGSTFKIVTAAAGLESGKLRATEPVYAQSAGYKPPQTTREIRNFGGTTCGGDLFAILRVSCNTAFAELAVQVGPDDMFETARGFGFTERPPIDLPGAASSQFREPAFFEDNLPLLAQSGIGQNEVQATPLQMALITAAVANDGEIMKPHVMAEIRDDEGELVEEYEADEWTTAMSSGDAELIKEAMVGVVERGTARNLRIPGVRVAGKTGTAQLGTDPPRSHAWIVGLAPADEPSVVVAVIVEGQPGASEQTGGAVAAPIAKAVIEAALAAQASGTGAGADGPES